MGTASKFRLDTYEEMVLEFVLGAGMQASLPPLMGSVAHALAMRGLLENDDLGWRVTNTGREALIQGRA